MNNAYGSITPAELRHFAPLRELSDHDLADLAGEARVEYVPTGARIVERGTTDNWTIYLARGKLALEAADGAVVFIESGTPKGSNPIARLQPRQYLVTSVSAATIIRLQNDKLHRLLERPSAPAYDVSETSLAVSSFASELCCELYRDIQEDKLVLPSLPEVAVRVCQLLERNDVGFAEVAKVIRSDSAMSAKIIKVANSSFYAGQNALDSCIGAITRLGTAATTRLVLSFAMRELFEGGTGLLRERMLSLWEHSATVAALSHAIAKRLPQFQPDRAFLAGLMHDIGHIAILSYAKNYPEAGEDSEQLDEISAQLRGQIGRMILQKWNFPADVVTAAQEAEDWYRDLAPDPDYCDIVLIAQLHSFIIDPPKGSVPFMSNLPAFRKLSLTQIAPNIGVEILEEAKQQVGEVKRLLAL